MQQSAAPSAGGFLRRPEALDGVGPQTPRAHRRNRSRGGWATGLVAVFAVTTLLSLLFYRKGWVSPSTTWAGSIGDSEQMLWFLGWVPHALAQGHSGLFTNYVFYPSGVNVMWNTSILLPALVVSPLTVLAGPIVSYNLLITVAPIAAGCSAYIAFCRWVSSRTAAAIAAIVFAFNPFLIQQGEMHQQLSLLALLPLIGVLVDEIVVRQRWRWWVSGGLLGLAAAAQLMTGEEMLIIAVLGAVVAVVVLAVLHPRRIPEKLPYAFRSVALSVAVFALLVAYPLYVQLRGPEVVRRPIHPPGFLSSNLQNFVQPFSQLINPNIVPPPHTWYTLEPNAYVGIPLLLAVALGTVLGWRRRQVVPVAATLFVVFAVCSLGPTLQIGTSSGGWLPWRLLQQLPLLGALLPGRLPVLVDFAATLLLAVLVDLAVTAWRSWLPRLAVGVLTAAVVAFWIPAPPRVTTVRTPAFFTTAAEQRIPQGSVVLVSPYVGGFFSARGLVWQSVGGMRYRMVGGFFIVPGSDDGPSTPASRTLEELQGRPVAATPARRDAFLGYLRSVGIKYVLVGPSPGERRTVRFMDAALGSPTFRSGGVTLWRVARR